MTRALFGKDRPFFLISGMATIHSVKYDYWGHKAKTLQSFDSAIKKFFRDLDDVLDDVREQLERTASMSRKAGLYDRLKQDLRKHGSRLMLTLMGDACEKISDELRRNGQLEESKAWDKNIDLLYNTAKKVLYG